MSRFSRLLTSALALCMISFAFAPSVMAAKWKPFDGFETGLILLQPDMGASDIEKASKKMVHSIGQRQVNLLTQPLKDLEKKLAPEISKYREDLSRSLKPYRVEDAPRYEQLESMLHLAQQSNTVLHKAYFITEALNANQKLLPQLKKQLRSGNISGKERAALGVAAMSLGYFTLHAIDYAKVLPKDMTRLDKNVSQKISQVRKKITANPFSAMQLGQELTFLLEAQGVIGRVSKTTGQSVQSLPKSAQELAEVVTSVSKLF